MEITAKNISLLPSRAACLIGKPSSSFLKIFSVTTIPSSTTKPVAKTIPSKVRILIEKPEIYMIKKVAIKDIGISIKGLMAVNQSRKKKKTTSTTKAKEIKSDSSTSLIDLRMFCVLSSNTFNSMSDLLSFFMDSNFLLKSFAI